VSAAGSGFAGGLAAAPGGGLKGSRRGRRGRRGRWTFDKISLFVVFLGIPLAIFLIFVISPFAQAMFYSFTNWGGFSSNFDFIGLGQFQKLLGDDVVLTAFRNNVILALAVPFITIVIALAFASAITVGGPSLGPIRGIRGSSFYRVVSFFPYTIPAIVIGIIWAGVFDPSHGILNAVLNALGLPFQSFAWLGEEATARPALIFLMVWSFVGFYMVLFVAAIKGVPSEIYEAARLDGAGRFRMTMSITLPSIRDNVQTAYIYLGITALDGYVYATGLTPGGGPSNTTLVVPQKILQNLFTNGQASYASAMGVALSLVTLLFAVVVFTVARIARGREEARS
jgi:N-acetylglucosamine transport system permease protein